jgi:1,4-dihydroxy-2-naphthoate octaprenyltransferase
MAVLKSWVLAARPKTLPAAIVPVWAGCLVAWSMTGNLSWRLAVLTVLGALFIQIATNFFNDVIDAEKGADTDQRLGPKRAVAGGLLSPRALYQGAIFLLVQAVVCGIFLFQARGWPILLIGIPSLYLSYGYTGGKFPLAYLGLGELFVILFFGLVAVAGTVFIQIGEWPMQAWLVGLQIGLLSAVLIAVNNYRDLEEDRAAQKRTLVVRWGRKPVALLIYLMTVLPAGLVLLTAGPGLCFVISLLLALVFLGLEFLFLKPDEVAPQLLGLSALHLVLFVFAWHLCLALT